ncbi:MAG: DUF3667 domain-containing protein [Hyphomonadaceae bacterium]
MSGELEAAGALATAGAVGAAIEGREGGAPGEGRCPNCDAPITGRYCSNCGQHTAANRRLTHVAAEFLHNLWHLDTKTWRTLPMVVFRPGTLTRNYVYGKRARYLSPLTMFLFAIFLLFFAFSFVDAPVELDGTPQQQRAGLEEAVREAQAELTREERESAVARAQPPDQHTGDLDARLAQQEVDLARAQLERMQAALRRFDEYATRRANGENDAIDAEAEAEIDGVGWLPGETWQDGFRRMAQREDFKVSNDPAINARMKENFANPDLMVYRVQEAASKFAFLLAPLSLPFIMLLFLWKRGLTMYDHIAYALYALAFAAFLFSAIIGITKIPGFAWFAALLFWLGLPVHTYFHLKGAYALGWWSAGWRTFFMLQFAAIIASLFLALIIVVGLLG